MKNAIILHGCPEKENYYDTKKPSESNAHWLPWLQKELVIQDVKADTPEISHAYEPDWEIWCREVERFGITPDTTLVGHSAGAGFWLKYLSVHTQLQVDKVILVAPWLDPDHTLADQTFFKCMIDKNVVSRTRGIVIFVAPDDSESTLASVDRIKRVVEGVTVREFPHGYGHFTYENLQTIEFPELRDELLK